MEEKEFDQLTEEEKKERFQKAVENYNKGFVEENYAIKSVAFIRVEDALEYSGRILEEFKPTQRKVLFEAAQSDVDLDYFMNPKFSAAHMKFILEQLQHGKDVTWLPVGKFHENIVRKPLTRAAIADIKKRMENKASVIADLKEKKKETGKNSMKQEKSKQRGER